MPRFNYFCLKALLVGCCSLSILLVGCGPNTPSVEQPAAAPTATVGIMPTWTAAPPPKTTSEALSPNATGQSPQPSKTALPPLPNEDPPGVTVGPPSGEKPLCYFSADYFTPPFGQQIKESQDIVQAEVTTIGPMIWNTVDGRVPANACDGKHDQISQLDITIKESYKGSLTPGSKLTLWLNGAPGSLKQGNYDYFPKQGEIMVFFLAEEYNARSDTPATPLNARIVRQRYRLQTPGVDKWVSQITNTPFTLEWLKAVIKDPTIEPTRTPFPPTPTPYVRTGQTLQPTNYYNLSKATSINIKSSNIKPSLADSNPAGSDRFNRLLKAFDRPLKVLDSKATYPYSTVEPFILFFFNLPDNSVVSFYFDIHSDRLTHQLRDSSNFIQLEAPPELKSIFGQ